MRRLVCVAVAAVMMMSLTGCGFLDFLDENTEDIQELTTEVDIDTTETIVASTEEITTEEPEATTSEPARERGELSFSTTDIDGNAVTDEITWDAKVVMVNFWEPWCGPCVGEMPDIERLYEEYKDQGFLVIGVFTSSDMESEARDVMNYCGTTYPIIHYTNDLYEYTTDYVPTTIFVDGDGYVLSDEPMVGAYSYEDWKSIIEGYLQ